VEDEPAVEDRSIRARQAVGLDGGSWIGQASVGDQAAEDGRSLTFDSAPLAEGFEVLGYPRVALEVSSDRPVALVAARICDVAPDGTSRLVARGLLNLTHRESHAEPAPLEPGRRYAVEVECDLAAHAFPAGNRIRVALSPAYWPWVWPSPETVTLTFRTGGESRLELPVRPRPADEPELGFEEAETAEPLAVQFTPSPRDRVLRRNLATGEHVIVEVSGHGTGLTRYPDGLVTETANVDRFTIRDDDPLSAVAACERTVRVGRDEWQTRVETRSTMSAGSTDFFLVNTLEAFENDVPVFARSWTKRIPRDHV
jgi:hypothetical protein